MPQPRIGFLPFVDAITELEARADTSVLPPSRAIELPCCYDRELGLDLEKAAERLNLSVAELVELHARPTYHLYFIGFTPGLPYMTGMPERILLPRLETPRTSVQAL